MNKKLRIIIIVTLLIGVVSILVVYTLQKNTLILKNLTEDVKRDISYEKELHLIDIQAEYEKLNGNGNDIQYFVAALVKAEEEKTVKTFTDKLQDEYEVLGYIKQEGIKIESEYIEHIQMSYDVKNINWEDDCYYMIYFYSSYKEGNNILDIKGH